MDLNSPQFIILLIIGIIVMFAMMRNKKKIKALRKENRRMNYEVQNQALKNKMIELKQREKELRKKGNSREW